jgi:hypothetical protein
MAADPSRRPQFNRDLQTQSWGKASRNEFDYRTDNDIDNDVDNKTDNSNDNDADNDNDNDNDNDTRQRHG